MQGEDVPSSSPSVSSSLSRNLYIATTLVHQLLSSSRYTAQIHTACGYTNSPSMILIHYTSTLSEKRPHIINIANPISTQQPYYNKTPV